MARWVELPLDQGVVNSRAPSQLQYGELTQATNCVYRRGSKQLHPKDVWTKFPHQLRGIVDTSDEYHNGRTYPNSSQLWLANNGPEVISFEGKGDWLVSIVDRYDDTELTTFRGAEIWFAPTDGSADWVRSEYVLRDNEALRYDSAITENTQYQISHWGDSYLLSCNQGLAVIREPSGTGIPEVYRLGMYAPMEFGMGKINDLTTGNSWSSAPNLGMGTGPGAFFESTSGGWLATDTITSDFVENDIISLFITEYNVETGEESLPIWVGGPDNTATYFGSYTVYTSFSQVQSGDVGDGLRVILPPAFFNLDQNTNRPHLDDLKFRVYLKYWGNSANSDDVLGAELLRSMEQYEAGIPGMQLLDGGYGTSTLFEPDGRAPTFTEFNAGDTIYFTDIQKTIARNPYPVVPVDNARLLFWRYRRPHCSAVGAIWNDSLCIADYGTSRLGYDESAAIDADADDYDEIYGSGGLSDPVNTTFEQASPAPSRMGYSMPGEFESHPDAFFINFATRNADAARSYHVIGNRLIAICEDSVHLVNYLPFSGLVQNQQGRVKSTVIEGKGAISFHATAKISTASGEFAVWASEDGLNWTNGTGWSDACPDFKMPSDLTSDQKKAVRLVNDAEFDRLHLFVDRNEYVFHYSPDHLKNNTLKMTGPHPYEGIVSGAAFRAGVGFRMKGLDLEWTQGAATRAEATVYTGEIAPSDPFDGVEVQALGLTKSAISGKFYARADAATRGRAIVHGNEAEIEAPDVADTNLAATQNRGQYNRNQLRVSETPEDWGIGPAWINGNVGGE